MRLQIEPKDKVYNLIILDESGSMECIKRQALSGLNETLQTIRSSRKEHPETEQYVSIVSFSSDRIKFLRDKEEIENIKDLKKSEYIPNSCTPLYDAIGLGINSLRKFLTEKDTVLVTIITDGEENSSCEYNIHSIRALIEQMKERNWLFTYIGANQDAISVANSININNALNFTQDDEGTRMMFEKERHCRKRFYDICCNHHNDSSMALHEISGCINYFDEDSDSDKK